MGLKSWIQNRAVRKALEKRYKAMNNDRKTTLLGFVLAALIAAKLDFGLLIEGDLSQIGLAVGAIVTAVLSFYINKPSKKND